jgi:argininosuccinate synthase
MKKVVLGFSGGLDTSYCAKYFTKDKGYEVHSVIVNTGGFSAEELADIEKHAYKIIIIPLLSIWSLGMF